MICLSYTFPEMVCNNLTNIDRKACNNILKAVNKLAFSAPLGHSCETGELIMIPFIILNKTL